jgi:hypothetical protein
MEARNRDDTGVARRFGLVVGTALPALFGLFLPWLFDAPWPLWPWPVACVLIAFALCAPRLLVPLERLWMRVAHVLGRINGMIVLTLVYYLVITPTAIVMRWRRRDYLKLNRDVHRQTYRLPTPPDTDKDRIRRPF